MRARMELMEQKLSEMGRQREQLRGELASLARRELVSVDVQTDGASDESPALCPRCNGEPVAASPPAVVSDSLLACMDARVREHAGLLNGLQHALDVDEEDGGQGTRLRRAVSRVVDVMATRSSDLRVELVAMRSRQAQHADALEEETARRMASENALDEVLNENGELKRRLEAAEREAEDAEARLRVLPLEQQLVDLQAVLARTSTARTLVDQVARLGLEPHETIEHLATVVAALQSDLARSHADTGDLRDRLETAEMRGAELRRQVLERDAQLEAAVGRRGRT